MHPRASITLDHARLSVLYTQGITWVLTTDLGLPDNSLADHLQATAQVATACCPWLFQPLSAIRTLAEEVACRRQGFWSVAKGSRKRLLSSCNYRRDDYKAAVTAAASLMAPYAMVQLSADFRYACSLKPLLYTINRLVRNTVYY